MDSGSHTRGGAKTQRVPHFQVSPPAQAGLKLLKLPGLMGSLSGQASVLTGGCGHTGSPLRRCGHGTGARETQLGPGNPGDPRSRSLTFRPGQGFRLLPTPRCASWAFSSPLSVPPCGPGSSGWPCLSPGHSVQSGRTLSPWPARAWSWDLSDQNSSHSPLNRFPGSRDTPSPL